MLLDGIHVPLTTPFYPDGCLNLRKLEHNVDRFSRTPAAGLVLTSTVGEGTALTDTETREVWTSAIGAAGAEKVMVAAVNRDAVLPVLELIDAAAALHFDAVLLGRPASAGEREIMTYFGAIADRSALPIVLLSDSTRTLEVDTIAALAQHPGILGVVDHAGRIGAIRQATAEVHRQATVTTIFAAVTKRMMAQTAIPVAGSASYIDIQSLAGGGTAVATPLAAPALKTRMRDTGFQVLGGTSATILDDLRAGAAGSVPVMAACAPQACYEILAGWKDGNAGLAEEKQARVLSVAARVEEGLSISSLKYACDWNGYFGGTPRLPLVMCTGQERAEIESLMRGMRN